MRKKIIAGNWKMNTNMEEALALASEVIHIAQDEVPSSVTLIMSTPFVYLNTIKKLISEGKNIYLGAQNCHTETSGAFTGEISAPMLQSIGIEYVIVGHSERREYFQENNAQLAKKVDLLISYGMIPIFCCGESLDIRKAGTHLEFVKNQLTESLFHLSAQDFEKIVIAYEPIWAIGTGETASSAQAQEMHQALRNHIADKYTKIVADKISILYGGSMKPNNAAELLAEADVDGGLIGGASLKSREFIDIAKSYPG
jgi:triosephosphate isomerase